MSNRLTVTASMTTPRRAGKQPRPVWIVDGPDIDAFEHALYDMGGHKYQGKFSFFEDVSDAVGALGDDDKLSFRERQELAQARAGERAERLSDRSDKHAAAADAAFKTAHTIMDGIPLGQPILVGHHSEGRHRRDLGRIESGMRKGIDEQQYSQHLAGRAAHAERVASGQHPPVYYENRVREDTAELRKIERYLARPDREPIAGKEDGFDVCTGEWRARLLVVKAGLEDKLTYWREQLAAAGVQFSRSNIHKGDVVRIRGSWMVVERANPTTVHAKGQFAPWGIKYLYSEIQEVRTPNAPTQG